MTVKLSRQIVEVDNTDDILCNRCGKSVRVDGQFEGININTLWGYGSRHDLELWKADLCQECSEKFEEWVGSGKIEKMICTVDGVPQMSKEEYEKRLDG